MESLKSSSYAVKNEESGDEKIKIIDISLKPKDIDKNIIEIKLPRSESCL